MSMCQCHPLCLCSMSSVHAACVPPAHALKGTHGPLLGLVSNCTQSHQQAEKVALSSVNYLSGVITCLLGGFVVTCTVHCTTPGLLSEIHNGIPNQPFTSLIFFFQLCLLVSVHLNRWVVFLNNCPSFLIIGERESGQGMPFVYGSTIPATPRICFETALCQCYQWPATVLGKLAGLKTNRKICHNYSRPAKMKLAVDSGRRGREKWELCIMKYAIWV